MDWTRGSGRMWALPLLSVALAVLLAVLVSRYSRSGHVELVAAKPRNARRRVVLLGVGEAGKTSVFLYKTLGVAPQTAISQRVNTGDLPACDRVAAIRLVDVPGHARLRNAVHTQLDNVDAIVFCVDASVASRGSAASIGANRAEDLHGALVECVDFIHETLRALAQKCRKGLPAPAVQVLFTRADLSPLFAERAMLKDQKRRAQLLARCRRGLEFALASRRTARGLQGVDGRSARVTIEGIGAVEDVRDSVVARVQRMCTPVLRAVPFLRWAAPLEDERIAPELHPTRRGHNVEAGAGHKQSNELAMDYVRTDVRQAGEELLVHLDARVVRDGGVTWGIASIDTSDAGWMPGKAAAEIGDLDQWLETL
ncbi:hypothetical protein MVES1_002851 [Malassezia vespertilionis]|uniref:Signal recognition particle receptor subunit beta n=1 Tax=Malassezia vespertilionis TaxID=2020962 RepID=A0A2N1JA89_9BASI|nr:uncharacterized protein MVES1_002851 [Malassezia vespertilionis]PKI83412.1 hypothetical protein MVES_002697 [Malassezia vespertilionis]WFD07485.1 hypothetical protein MVES1_002851 [Malassezia vespertilionis]